jgi:uncharacterized protein
MTTRIVVMADTHMPRCAEHLPPPLKEALLSADIVVHLGDFTDIRLAERLEQCARLFAVHGNGDSPEIRARFPSDQRIAVDGHTMALIHGHLGGRTALEAARRVHDADVVLFGHSHRAYCAREAGRLLFNPGSPTDRRFAPHCSFGVLEIAESISASVLCFTRVVDRQSSTRYALE